MIRGSINMSKKGARLGPKHGRSHVLRHESFRVNDGCESNLSLKVYDVGGNYVLAPSTEDPRLEPSVSSETEEGFTEETLTEGRVANDANLSRIKSVFQVTNRRTKNAVFENVDSSFEWMKTKGTDNTNHSSPCHGHDQDLGRFVGGETDNSDMLEMDGVGVVGVGNESINLPTMAMESNFLSTDFPDNLKDFVFSVTDNLKTESISDSHPESTGSADVGSSFPILLENDVMTEDNLRTDSGIVVQENGQSKTCFIKIEDPTMTSSITKLKGLLKNDVVELQDFTSLKTSSNFEKLENSNQNAFQSNLIKDEGFILTPSVDQESVTKSSSVYPASHAIERKPIPSNRINDINMSMSAGVIPNLMEYPEIANTSSVTPNQTGEIQTQKLENSAAVPLESLMESGMSVLSPQVSNTPDNNINVTTISISNQDEDATKILVDSNQGKQSLYVINTASLNNQKTTKSVVNENQTMYYIVNSSQSSIQTGSSIIGNGGNTSQQFISLQAPSANMSSFFLLPIVDSSNVVQTLQVQPIEKNNEIQKPAKKLLMCPETGCMKTFRKASKLKVHKMLHTGERPYKCTLLGCEWAFTTAHKLKRHLESHEGRKDFVCDYPGCGHKFTTIYNLNTHRKLHDRPCTESCPQEGCGLKFPTKRQLDLHLRNVHNVEERTFKCPKPGCDKVFYSSLCMGSHMRVHQQNVEDNIKCKFPGCNKEFSKLCRLRQHEKLHSGEKPFICNYEGCTWAFATASKLKRHQTKHTGVRKWQCPICRKHYQRSEHLKGHLITHSGKRPFVCPVEGCNYTFTAKSSLYVHIKKHDESGKTIVYHCPMEKCERHYANKASLRQHILFKHCSIPLKGSQPQGAINWLNLLGPGDPSLDIPLSQHAVNDGEGMAQIALAPGQDAVMSADILTGGMADQSLLNSSNQTLADQASNNIITQLMVSSGISPAPVASGTNTVAALANALPIAQSHQQHYQQVIPVGDLLQQQERMSIEAVERGKKSQFVFENLQGSARTDCRSNDIISQRALQRWQKQKEIEAAKLRAHLEAQSHPPSNATVIPTVSVADFKGPGSSFVSLAEHPTMSSILMPIGGEAGDKPAMIFKEIPDMELQAEGITGSILEGRLTTQGDTCMTELFIKDPETGMTYRQTQLLQDDPPNPCLLEDMGEVEPSHSVILDSGLDGDLIEESLNFQDLE